MAIIFLDDPELLGWSPDPSSNGHWLRKPILSLSSRRTLNPDRAAYWKRIRALGKARAVEPSCFGDSPIIKGWARLERR